MGEGNCLFSPGGIEVESEALSVRMRQQQWWPPVMMGPVHNFKIATQPRSLKQTRNMRATQTLTALFVVLKV